MGSISFVFLWLSKAGEVTVPSDSSYDVGVHLNFTDVAVDSYDNPKVVKVD